MFWRGSDLALDADPARRFLPWLIAMIVFLAGLALAGMMALSSAVERWDRGLSGTATVQVPAVSGENAASRTEDRLNAAVAALRRAPGVVAARALSEAETARLLEPWLGEGMLVKELPLPRLIDVKLRTEAPPDMAGLSSLLAEAVPGAVIDDHRGALERLIALARSVEVVALAIVVLVAFAAVATVVFITRTGLAVHAETIELLHLIGAQDGYVARQFQGQALDLAVKGGLVGLALTIGTCWVIGRFAGNVTGGVVPDLALAPAQWAALVAVPAAVAAIGVLTARRTVMHALRKLP